ncbi:MAG: dethiobiotin synthase [Planctomycetales bacterium]|nr:dethiobiotin synthase [Planctomycetales bacterium]NIM09938.1 dethiobiotin synthase [Planctomycetales bacterium]NIN09378.1 dethiobiotin synthase [Planctomycetales bacterium]NIN78485.1 dethiobiotin synthase [Planctomycetales bacterium]NIO35677.1 dethiobiotin synthase [Planctomycetales bacterium]
MESPAQRGLFVTGTGTEVGKTYVAALIARQLSAEGRRVGVYKPVASGCRQHDGQLVSDDALQLWEAAGRPGRLADVCPQNFAAPLAPHLAARAAGDQVDARLLREGLNAWQGRCDIVLVEGAGGLMSPLADDTYNATLAAEFGFPLVVVAANRLGVINQVLQTVITAGTVCKDLVVAGVVLNNVCRDPDISCATNRQQLQARCGPPVLAEVGWQAEELAERVDWYALA